MTQPTDQYNQAMLSNYRNIAVPSFSFGKCCFHWARVSTLFIVLITASAKADNVGALLQTYTQVPPTNFARFGQGVAGIGQNVLIGGTRAGSAYIFDGTSGSLLRTIPDPNSAGGDGFGFSVAATPTTAFVGARLDSTVAYQSGKVYSFDAATAHFCIPGAIQRARPIPTLVALWQFRETSF